MKKQYKEHVELINQQIKELVGIYRDVIKHLDITESEFWIWYTLVAMDGEFTQQDISAIWSLPKQTVNTLITRMRLKKFAYLEVVPGTRNCKIVRLTEEGRRFGEKMIFPISNAEERAFENISKEEFSLVTNTFSKYISFMRKELSAQEN